MLDVTLVDMCCLPLVVDHARWTLHDGAELTGTHDSTKMPIWAAIVGLPFIHDGKIRDPMGTPHKGMMGCFRKRAIVAAGEHDDEDIAREARYQDVEAGAASGFAWRVHFAEPVMEPPPKPKRTFRQTVRAAITALYD